MEVVTRPVFSSSVLPAHERGLELGERFASQIASTVAAYRLLFETRALAEFDVDLWSDRAWDAISRLAPHHAEEIAGIAEGAGLRAEQIASINARTELLVAANPTGATECSTVVSLPQGKDPVAVQTWDWYDAMSDGWFTWTIPMPDGRRIETVTEFGLLAKIGMNDRGVGVMLNMLHHANDQAAVADGKIGHPVHLLSRSILEEAASTRDAVQIASAPETTASSSLTVVDPTGDAVSIELFPGGPGLVDPADRLLVRTNHFVSEEGRGGCLASTISESTRLRREHLLGEFGSRAPETTAEVVDAMTNHHELGGVCRHDFTHPDPVLWHRTLATVRLDPGNRRLDVSDGGPCGHREGPVAG